MKSVSLFLLLFLFLHRASAQEKNLDTLARKAFAAMRNADEEAFVKLFPDAKQFAQMLALISNPLPKANDSLRTGTITSEDSAMYEMMLRKVREAFRDQQKKLATRKIDPSTIVLTACTIDSSKVEVGLRMGKGEFAFTSGDVEYKLSFTEAVWSPEAQGWFGLIYGHLRLKGEPEEAPVRVMEDVEVNDSVEPPPPPDPPKKQTPAKPKTPVKKPVRKLPVRKP